MRAIYRLKDKISDTLCLLNLVKISFALSSSFSIIVLYLLYPESYWFTWKGRAYYIFFLWLVLLELTLNWGKIDVKARSSKSKRFSALVFAIFLPILYILIAYSVLNSEIVNVFPKHYGISVWAESMPITIEYIVLASLFSLIAILAYGWEGLGFFVLPISLLWAIGLIFLVDNLYPFGKFTPFQILVPATAILASGILSLIGYNTELRGQQAYGVTVLRVWNDKGEASFGIAWPCSGVEGLIIYSVITALFLRDSTLSRNQKICYFLIGAIITYIVNVFRIAKIFIIAIEHGVTSLEVRLFHDYYGPLYSAIWVATYPLIIFVTQPFWRKVKSKGVIVKRLINKARHTILGE